MTQPWNFRDILGVHPESDQRCVAIVENGQRCPNDKTVGYMNLIEAEGLVDFMDEIENLSECRRHLQRLAYLMMCGNEHRKTETASKERCKRWNKQIDAYIAERDMKAHFEESPKQSSEQRTEVTRSLYPESEDRAFISRISTIIDIDNPFIDSSVTTTWLPNGLPSPPRSARGRNLPETQSPPETPQSTGGVRLELPPPTRKAPGTPPRTADNDSIDTPVSESMQKSSPKKETYTFAGDSPTLGCYTQPPTIGEPISDSDSDTTKAETGLGLVLDEVESGVPLQRKWSGGLDIPAPEEPRGRSRSFSAIEKNKQLPDLPAISNLFENIMVSPAQGLSERQIQFHQTKDGSWDLVLEATPDISLDLASLGARTSASSHTLSVGNETEDGDGSPRGRRGSHQIWQRIRTSVTEAVQKSPQRRAKTSLE